MVKPPAQQSGAGFGGLARLLQRCDLQARAARESLRSKCYPCLRNKRHPCIRNRPTWRSETNWDPTFSIVGINNCRVLSLDVRVTSNSCQTLALQRNNASCAWGLGSGDTRTFAASRPRQKPFRCKHGGLGRSQTPALLPSYARRATRKNSRALPVNRSTGGVFTCLRGQLLIRLPVWPHRLAGAA